MEIKVKIEVNGPWDSFFRAGGIQDDPALWLEQSQGWGSC